MLQGLSPATPVAGSSAALFCGGCPLLPAMEKQAYMLRPVPVVCGGALSAEDNP